MAMRRSTARNHPQPPTSGKAERENMRCSIKRGEKEEMGGQIERSSGPQLVNRERTEAQSVDKPS